MGATDNRADQAIKDIPRETNQPTENVMAEVLDVSAKDQRTIFEGVGGRGQDVPASFKSADGSDAHIVGDKNKPEASAAGEKVVTVGTVSLREGFAPGEDSMAAVNVRVREGAGSEAEPSRPEQREGPPAGGGDLLAEDREAETADRGSEDVEAGAAEQNESALEASEDAAAGAEAGAEVGKELGEANRADAENDAAASGTSDAVNEMKTQRALEKVKARAAQSGLDVDSYPETVKNLPGNMR